MASNILRSLGSFTASRSFGKPPAGAGIAQRLGGLAGRGISAFSGGVSRGAAGAGGALGSALGRGLAGRGAVNNQRITGSTIAPFPQRTGAAGAPASRYNPTPQGQGLFDRGPGRPGLSNRRGTGSGPGGATAGGGGVFGMSADDVHAQSNARLEEWRERNRQDQERARVEQANTTNVSAYNEAFASANEANEARYQQLLGIADSTTGQRAKDITSDFAGQQSAAMQNLARLGLANTSGASTIRGGFGRKRNEALDRMADQMQQTKLGIIERRTDKAPDLASLISLGKLGISGLKF